MTLWPITSTASRLALTAVVLALASPALAQAAPPTATAGEDANVIVVTAQRRSENIQSVPLSVSVLNSDALAGPRAGGADSLLSLSGKVPSLYVESTTGRIFPRFYIRGLGNVDFYLGASQPVSIIQDDVVLEHVVLKSNPVYDVAQIEVLRGPQGSLFGRNTTAGIIKFASARPTKDWSGHLDASRGSYNTQSVEGAISGPVTHDGAVTFRLSSLYQHRDNWVTNTYTGTSFDGTVGGGKSLGRFTEADLRFQLQFEHDPATTINLASNYRTLSGTSTLFYRASLAKGTNQPVASWNQTQVAFDEAQNNQQNYSTYGQTLNARHDFGAVNLTSITSFQHADGWSRGDTDGGAAANFPFNGVPNGFGQSQGRLRGLDQWTQELRLASQDNAQLKWQIGGIYFDARDTTEFYQRGYFIVNSPAYNPNNWVQLRNVNTSWGLFGQAAYAVNDRLTVTGGARVSNDTKTTRLLKTANTAAGIQTYTGRTNVRLADTQPSWDLSMLYKASPEVNLYARVARGFRGPTIQGRSAVFNADFTTANSETNTSWEAGMKTTGLGGALRFNVTGFYYTVKNIQLNGNDSNGNGVLFNANKAVGYGGEADLSLKTGNLTLGAGLSLLHTEIKDSNVFAQTCGLNGVQVCTVYNSFFTRGAGTGTTYFAAINGNPLPNAPTYNANLSARYDVPLANGAKLFAAGDWNIQGKTSFVLYKSAEFYANGNNELGLRAGYSTPHYEVAVFARNVLNHHNLIGVIENYMAGVYNEPRIIGLSVSLR